MREIKQIIVHCSDTYADMDIGAGEIRQWHIDRGWSDIGYNYVINRAGTLQLGRDPDGDGNVDEEVGAHALGYNESSIGICMVGGKAHPGEEPCNFTSKQWDTLNWLVFTKLKNRYPSAEIIGHNDVSDKTCPTFNVKAWASERLKTWRPGS